MSQPAATTTTTTTVPLWINPRGGGPEAATDNLLFFSIDTNATLTCQNEGSRCSFIDSFFEEVEAGDGGSIAAQVQGFIWAVGNSIACSRVAIY